MVNKIIDFSINNKFLVLAVTFLVVLAGIFSIKNIALDAIPDLSETQVIIKTQYHQQTPQVIEDQVTYPISSAMLGLPNTKVVRGFSMFGTSFVYVIFNDSVDQYWARSRVLEKLSELSNQLPEGVNPTLGVDATGVGWVYQYVLVDSKSKYSLSDLRTMQDWFIKYELTSLPGVAEVASIGGYVKQYEVQINPQQLRAYDLKLKDVVNAVKSSSSETGARTLEIAEAEYLISTKAYAKSATEIENAVVKSQNGNPILIKDIANVVEVPAFRRGLAEYNGQGEAVGGIVIMPNGNNTLDVIANVKQKIKDLNASLPDGLKIVSVYDRSDLIYASLNNLKEKLLEEALVVFVVIFLFLMHVRSSIVAFVVIPTAILASFIVMYLQGIQANIMSLSGIAIAIGAMVDASIVMIENAHKNLANKTFKDKDEYNKQLVLSIKQVAGGIFFSLLIITVSFIPVFALTGQSEKLFEPLAYTKTYAMAFAAIFSITLIPVLMLSLLKGKLYNEDKILINRVTKKIYAPALQKALDKPKAIIIGALVVLVLGLYPLTHLKTQFMPDLNEGSLLYMPMTLPSISEDKMLEVLNQTNKLIKQVLEVESVFAKAGRADTSTDPAPLAMIETWVNLKPMDQWRDGVDIQDIKNELNDKVKIPGFVNSWGYPIKIRLDMLSTGIKTALGVKISGDNLSQIDKIAKDIEQQLKGHEHIKSVIADRTQGANYINITPKYDELAKYGLSIDDFNNTIKYSLAGVKQASVIDGRKRFDITVRYDKANRENIDDIKNILVDTASGGYIPLSQVADIKITKSASMIKSENARLNGWVFVDVDSADVNSTIKYIQSLVGKQIKLPAGYTISFAGSYEQMQLTNQRLAIAIPLTIILVIYLLFLHFRDSKKVAIVLSSLPFALIGAFVGLFLFGINISVATVIGIIALSGLALETAIIMLMYIDNQITQNNVKTKQEFIAAVKAGALLRLRPKLMTALTVIIGLLPIFAQSGIGSDVMQAIAMPMLAGMISVMLTVLFIIPVVYILCYNKNYE